MTRDERDSENGWRTGRDPILRWLRAATVVAFVAVFVLVSLDHDRDTTAIATILGIAGGGVLILLGYQGVISLPYIGRREDRRSGGDKERD